MKYVNKSLTLISTKAKVAFPTAHVNERYKWIDVCPTASAADNHARLDDWQLLFVNRHINTDALPITIQYYHATHLEVLIL